MVRKPRSEANAGFEVLPTMSLLYKNIFDGEGAGHDSSNYFGPLAGANGSLCQQGTNI